MTGKMDKSDLYVNAYVQREGKVHLEVGWDRDYHTFYCRSDSNTGFGPFIEDAIYECLREDEDNEDYPDKDDYLKAWFELDEYNNMEIKNDKW